MDVTAVLQILLHGNQLKRTTRTGWAQRGVPQPESVAAHSFGVTYTALILAQLIEEPVDTGKLLAMATIHDLPEGLTTDIPSPAWRFLPDGIKTDVERSAMREILPVPLFADTLLPIWEELHANESNEAKLVHDADKLEMCFQVTIYEKQFGNAFLVEFWEKAYKFNFSQAQTLYNELRNKRDDMLKR